MPRRRLYLHVGLSKSGTTYLQRALWASREDLAARGVLYPGATPDDQRHAAWDLLGRRLRGSDQPHLPGSWDRLVADIRRWEGEAVVLSEEFLVHARPRHVRRIQRDLEDFEVHVVLTVRDLARTIPSMWQQELVMGHAWRLEDYVAAVHDPEHGPAMAGVRFWLRFDLGRILRTWRRLTRPRRIHVVVVPPPGSPPTLLAERFAQAIDVESTALRVPEAPVNNSLGVVEAELLYRLNDSLGRRLPEREQHYLVEQVIRPALKPSAPVALPPAALGWVQERAREQVALLQERRYDVIGEVTELVPATTAVSPAAPHVEVEEADVSAAAVSALHALMLDYGRHRARQRRKQRSDVALTTRVESSARAMAFGAKYAVLTSADKSTVASRLANAYLRLRSRRA
jgi:hypothetical protein